MGHTDAARALATLHEVTHVTVTIRHARVFYYNDVTLAWPKINNVTGF